MKTPVQKNFNSENVDEVETMGLPPIKLWDIELEETLEDIYLDDYPKAYWEG
jgi:hypothetical protein